MIRSETMWEIEVIVYDGNGRMGKLDLYDNLTNQFYEVKSAGAAPSAKKQMERYTDTREIVLYGHRYQTTISPGNAYIKGQFDYGNYTIDYESSPIENGLIVYKPELRQTQSQPQEEYATRSVPNQVIDYFPVTLPGVCPVPGGGYSYGGGGGGGGTWYAVLHPQMT